MNKRHWKMVFLAAVVSLFLIAGPSVAASGDDHSKDDNSINWWSLVKPLGSATLVLLLCTAALGFTRKLNYKVIIKLHKISAILTIICALSHGIIIFFL